MKKFLAKTVLFLAGINCLLLLTTSHKVPVASQPRMPDPVAFTTTFQPSYTSLTGSDEPDENTQVPIPHADRVYNYTGIQCVWSTIETLGRWAREPKLMNPPLTSNPRCKSEANPSDATEVLTKLHVRYEQTYSSMEESFVLMRRATKEGRGCLITVPHHAMTLVHFDEANDVIKWIDNVDKSLKIQTTSLKKFKQQRLTAWTLVIYADNDIIETRITPLPRLLPIFDRNNPQQTYPKDYIPLPKNRQ